VAELQGPDSTGAALDASTRREPDASEAWEKAYVRRETLRAAATNGLTPGMIRTLVSETPGASD
jgi:hypothetical protein